MATNSARGKDWEVLRKQCLERDAFICQLGFGACTTNATEADHVVPLSKGGTNELHNLQASCKSCNVAKGTQILVRKEWVDTWFADKL